MSALIRYFLAKGKHVAGYDRTPSPLTDQLAKEGVAIHFTEDVSLIPDDFRDKDSTWVVYTPAVPSSHEELVYFQANDFIVLKRSQVLGLLSNSPYSLCIAGTHGKTTTTSMTAHLFKQSSVDCNAFLGGILKNYNSNLLISDKSDVVVVEADEYDRSFHALRPYMAVITAADPDHLDIYGSPQAYRESFEHFTSLIQTGGSLIMKKGIDITPALPPNVALFTYSATDESADFHATNIRVGNGKIVFDFVAPSYNDEVINPHIINRSGLLRSARNDGDLNRHHSFLQGISPMPGTYNDETRNPFIARWLLSEVEIHEAIQIESLVSGLLRSARNDGVLYRHHSFLQGIFPMPGAYNDEVVNLHNIRNSGLLLASCLAVAMTATCIVITLFLQGILPMPAARNDGDLYRNHSQFRQIAC